MKLLCVGRLAIGLYNLLSGKAQESAFLDDAGGLGQKVFTYSVDSQADLDTLLSSWNYDFIKVK
jgi:hypothetical protein